MKEQTTTEQRAARSKMISLAIADELVMLQSPLKKSYERTQQCASWISVNYDQQVVTKRCKNRWCIQCNRIRTAQQIREWAPVLATISKPKFVTLTVVNCSPINLPSLIQEMYISWCEIKDIMRKKGVKLVGLRKLEITYNSEAKTYHPHFHIILSNEKHACSRVVSYWLKKFPTSESWCQNVTDLSKGWDIELFKYFTKIVYKINGVFSVDVKVLDHIMRSIKGKRTFQSFGIKKLLECELLQTEGVAPLSITPNLYKWCRLTNDWIALKHLPYAYHKPSLNVKNLVLNIKQTNK